LRDLERQGLGGAPYFVERHQHFGQPDPDRFVARDPAPCVEHQSRLLGADPPRQRAVSRSRGESPGG